MLHELRPDLIVETGTAEGGSAMYLCAICDLLDHGRIISIDIAAAERPTHPRLEYVTASSIAPETLELVRDAASSAQTVLVILDSDHSRDHVLAELHAYAPIVTSGSYVVVEDTNVNGHPVFAEHGAGPWEAVDAFLAQTSDFTPDRSREKFMFTFNPRGYLRKR
jgi:cephalosporin hydroxylase